jgi:hypothetical protein
MTRNILTGALVGIVFGLLVSATAGTAPVVISGVIVGALFGTVAGLTVCDVHVALRDAFDAARRQLEDYARRRRHEVKTHAERPHPARVPPE